MPTNNGPGSITPLENRITYQCLIVATRISQFMLPMWEEQYGLTVITWRVMAVIGRHGPLSAKEVARHTSTDAFFVSRAIVQLLKLGYISKGVDPADRRRSTLALTPTGRRVRDEAEAVISRVEDDLLEALDPAERAAARGLVGKLAGVALERLQPPLTWRDFSERKDPPAAGG